MGPAKMSGGPRCVVGSRQFNATRPAEEKIGRRPAPCWLFSWHIILLLFMIPGRLGNACSGCVHRDDSSLACAQYVEPLSGRRWPWLRCHVECPVERLFAGLTHNTSSRSLGETVVVKVSCGWSRRATLRWLDAQYVEPLSLGG